MIYALLHFAKPRPIQRFFPIGYASCNSGLTTRQGSRETNMKSRAGVLGARGLGIVLLGLAMLAPGIAAAQAVTGTILGTVTDSTGAVIAGAKVTVTNVDTGLSRTVTTDAAGEYTTPQVPTGNYTVLGEMSGFKATALSNVQVGVDQRVRIDV